MPGTIQTHFTTTNNTEKTTVFVQRKREALKEARLCPRVCCSPRLLSVRQDWERLRIRNAIWRSVPLASISFYIALRREKMETQLEPV